MHEPEVARKTGKISTPLSHTFHMLQLLLTYVSELAKSNPTPINARPRRTSQMSYFISPMLMLAQRWACTSPSPWVPWQLPTLMANRIVKWPVQCAHKRCQRSKPELNYMKMRIALRKSYKLVMKNASHRPRHTDRRAYRQTSRQTDHKSWVCGRRISVWGTLYSIPARVMKLYDFCLRR